MSKTTPATKALQKLGVKFVLHTYVYDSDAEHIGLQAAEALGVEPCRMLKTLMAEVDGQPVCVLVPSDSEVSMKKLARSRRRRSAIQPCSSMAASAACRSNSIPKTP